MKDLATVSKEEQDDFFKSFDYVFCDVDGVLWHSSIIIPGAREALAALKSLGKKIIFVSNNSTKSQRFYYNQLLIAGFELEQGDLVRPPLVMIDFLKKRNFSKKIYLLGMTSLRNELENAGFQIDEFAYSNQEESVPKYVELCISASDEVGAVIADMDLNMMAAHLQKACTYLDNPEVLFITGGSDKQLCFGPGQIIIGPGMYHRILEDMSGRKPYCLAKPGPEMNDFIKEKFEVTDASKVLFIGDSIPEDMGFATNSGYQKLLVLSGLTSREELDAWKFPEEYKPKYYAHSLKVVQDSLASTK